VLFFASVSKRLPPNSQNLRVSGTGWIEKRTISASCASPAISDERVQSATERSLQGRRCKAPACSAWSQPIKLFQRESESEPMARIQSIIVNFGMGRAVHLQQHPVTPRIGALVFLVQYVPGAGSLQFIY
jgi:hypothetical protein